MKLLESRILSIRRRADSLPKEIDQWLLHAQAGGKLEKNCSQLQAFDIFMSQSLQRLKQVTSDLSNLSQLTPSNTLEILNQAQIVEYKIFETNRIWSYFRGKIEQRFIPQFSRGLFVADLVSYDCYRTVMDNATKLGINHKLGLRDYPLPYLFDDYPSPATWSRKKKMDRLDYQMLPVPMIGVPWNYIINPWELLSLHHEVSHGIDIDLNQPSQELGVRLEEKLTAEGIPQQRARVWRCWMNEIFADFLGIVLAGPTFVSFLASFMTQPKDSVTKFIPNDPHPTPYLRTLLNCEFICHLSLGNGAQCYINNLLNQWEEVYGEPSQDIAVYVSDFSTVIETILSTRLDALVDKDGELHTFHELVRFGEEDFKNQLMACYSFLSDQKINTAVPIRHIIGAAYMAVEKQIDDDFAGRILERINEAIEAKAPRGQLALRTKQSSQYLKKLADTYFDNKLSINGWFYGQEIL